MGSVDEDYLVALQLQKKFDEEVSQERVVPHASNSLVGPEWEINDPNPDIFNLFQLFNMRFFWGQLGSVEVKWSPRMYTCAGICTYKGRAGCIVSLSLPLLKFRPRKDLVETLLHEMIHAYLFITKNNKDRTGHGPEFHKHMSRINKIAGTNITVFHAFHDEVKHYKTHVWRCDGECRANPPYFGTVRRAINRAPGPSDFWFPGHARTCGGSFHKIEEPDGYKTKKRKTPPELMNSKTKKGMSKDLTNYFDLANSPVSKISGIEGKSRINENNVLVKKIGRNENAVHGFNEFGQSSTSKVAEPKKTSQTGWYGGVYTLGGGHSNSTMINRGSGTLLERPKISSHCSNPTNTNNTQSTLPLVPLSGKGYLLSEVKKEVKQENSEIVDLTFGNSSPEREPIRRISCPVCNQSVININKHLDDCTKLESVLQSTTNTIMEDSDSDSDEYPEPETKNSNDSVILADDSNESTPEETFPCPNCSLPCSINEINRHLDNCLN